MPARLKMLSLTGLYTCISFEKYNVSEIQNIIDIHRDSLRFIELSRIPNENKTMPDFSRFPALVSLNMSAYDVMQVETPAAAFQKLSGTLEYMWLDITPEDQRVQIAVEQQAAWVTWLTEFAFEKQAHYPDSNLKEINVSTVQEKHNFLGLSAYKGFADFPSSLILSFSHHNR